MLVLSRKSDEKIVIGENIVVSVVRVNGNRVTIGIDAPRDMKITRAELLDSVRVGDREAAKPSKSASAYQISPCQ